MKIKLFLVAMILLSLCFVFVGCSQDVPLNDGNSYEDNNSNEDFSPKYPITITSVADVTKSSFTVYFTSTFESNARLVIAELNAHSEFYNETGSYSLKLSNLELTYGDKYTLYWEDENGSIVSNEVSFTCNFPFTITGVEVYGNITPSIHILFDAYIEHSGTLDVWTNEGKSIDKIYVYGNTGSQSYSIEFANGSESFKRGSTYTIWFTMPSSEEPISNKYIFTVPN
jgi:hypothetical protein